MAVSVLSFRTPSRWAISPGSLLTPFAEIRVDNLHFLIQGSYLITKLRPVDQLQSLLEATRGGGGEAVEGFFRLHKVHHRVLTFVPHSVASLAEV